MKKDLFIVGSWLQGCSMVCDISSTNHCARSPTGIAQETERDHRIDCRISFWAEVACSKYALWILQNGQSC